MRENSCITVAPDVGRITEGLRDTGYDLNTAIADLIDNSIAANATFIDVRIGVKENGDPVVGVGDNGHGMDEEMLINCMRYGSQTEDSATHLGKFGLGLKTASTAFCRRLVVASRAGANEKALQAVWDLDRLAQSGEWELEFSPADAETLEYLDLCTQKGPGTAVIWQKIDRLLTAEAEPASHEFASGSLDDIDERLNRITKNLREHLAMVFQRYLDPAWEDTRTVRLCLNGEVVEPWDPFCKEFSDGAGTHILTVSIGEDVAPITITAHLLPRAETLPEDVRAAARIDTNRQGIYVYRENRLIHGPDWLNIQAADPIWTLLRVSLSFDSRVDSVFMVDIKKSRVLINEHLYAWLKKSFLPSLLQKAEERWRQGAAETTRQTSETRHAVSDNVIAQHLPSLRKADVLEIRAESNEALVRNNSGTAKASVNIISDENSPLRHIYVEAAAHDDLLWEPALINGAPAVALNVGHPFYTRVYMPNEQNSPLVQGLDMLFWCLAQAEVNNVTEESRERFTALRAEFARNLGKLAQILPE